MAKGERRRALRGRAGRMKGGRGSGRASTGQVRLWGRHAVEAAIKNPDRVHQKLWATREAIDTLDGELPADFPIEYADVADLARMVAKDAPHQGLVLECAALEDIHLDEVLDSEPTRPIIVLDQVTDPHNVGAIMRSAVAFGAGALVTTQRHSPQESGVLAKAASGALEMIDHIEVRNLSAAIEELKSQGFTTIGLDSEGPEPIEAGLSGNRIALVLGAEGKGLRQKTRETVDVLTRLDMPGEIKSLNVSNATAIALYAAQQHLSKHKPA